MNIDTDFWSQRRVFLTGHTGFKGSWLGAWLSHLGADVRGYALPPNDDQRLFGRIGLADSIDSVFGDLRDAETLRASMKEFAPDVVMHLAAQPLVRYSYREPLETFDVNVMGTANLLEACRGCEELRSVVLVTTDKVYHNREWNWPYREVDALGGHDPYSASKACAELVVNAYRSSFFGGNKDDSRANLATARAGNVIGGGDWSADRLVPDAIGALIRDAELDIRYPSATRPWQHVLEPLAGYLMLARALFEGEHQDTPAWNFGPAADGDAAVSQVLDYIGDAWGKPVSWKSGREPQPHEASNLNLDSALATRKLHWEPKWDLQSAIQFTVNWYRAEHDGQNMREFTQSQIRDYELPLVNRR